MKLAVTYFHRNSRCIGRWARHDRWVVVRRSNRSMVHLARSYDPNDTSGNCIANPVAGPSTRMIDTRILFRFRMPIDRRAPMWLAILCRCSNGGRRTVRLSRRTHRCVVFDRLGCSCKPGPVSSTNSRNNQFLHYKAWREDNEGKRERERKNNVRNVCRAQSAALQNRITKTFFASPPINIYKSITMNEPWASTSWTNCPVVRRSESLSTHFMLL